MGQVPFGLRTRRTRASLSTLVRLIILRWEADRPEGGPSGIPRRSLFGWMHGLVASLMLRGEVRLVDFDPVQV